MMRNYQNLLISTLLVIGSFVNACEPLPPPPPKRECITFVETYPALLFFDECGFMYIQFEGEIYRVGQNLWTWEGDPLMLLD